MVVVRTGTSFVLASKATAFKTSHLITSDACSADIDLRTTHLIGGPHPVGRTAQQYLERRADAAWDDYRWLRPGSATDQVDGGSCKGGWHGPLPVTSP